MAYKVYSRKNTKKTPKDVDHAWAVNLGDDRVCFRVNYYSTQYRKLMDIYGDVFGFAISGSMQYGDVLFVLCEPEEFARFLILRNEAGLSNTFKELQPKMIHTGEYEPRTIEGRNIKVWDTSLQEVV